METVQSIREENALGGRNTQQWLVDVIKMAAELDKMAAVREKAALVLSLKLRSFECAEETRGEKKRNGIQSKFCSIKK